MKDWLRELTIWWRTPGSELPWYERGLVGFVLVFMFAPVLCWLVRCVAALAGDNESIGDGVSVLSLVLTIIAVASAWCMVLLWLRGVALGAVLLDSLVWL